MGVAAVLYALTNFITVPVGNEYDGLVFNASIRAKQPMIAHTVNLESIASSEIILYVIYNQIHIVRLELDRIQLLVQLPDLPSIL